MGNIEQRRKAMGLMAICAILWSIGGIFIKLISWNPFVIAGFRSLFAVAVIGIFMAMTGRKFKINKHSIIIGLGLAGCLLTYVIANKLTTAANAIVLQYTAPIFIVILSAVLFKKKMHRSEITVVSVTTAGIAMFFFDQLSPGSFLGNIIAIFSGVFMAIMFVFSGQSADDDSTRMSGLLLAHIIAAIIGISSLFFVEVHPTSMEIVYIAILGIFQVGIPYALYSVASKNCSPLACSLIGTLEPLLNPVWVFLFVGEAPGVFALIGAVIVIGAITTWLMMQSRNAKSQIVV